MKCITPYYNEKFGILCPCRQCLPCRINRRREWSVRGILEASQYNDISFITLTYDDDHLPLNGSLDTQILTKLWKRLRKLGLKFRYLACGEYGEKSYRPHYHAIIYGVDSVTMQYHLSRLWENGFVYCVPATVETIDYVCGYVTKKIAVRKEMQEMGMVPEFIRVSQGLGRVVLSELSKIALAQNPYDVISRIKIGGKDKALPRYLKEKLRLMCFDEAFVSRIKEARIQNMEDEVIKMVHKYFSEVNKQTVKLANKKETHQSYLNLLSKDKLWNLRSKV